DWRLTPANHIAGKVQALDGKTPLGSVVVELVQPEEALIAQPKAREGEAPTEPTNSPKQPGGSLTLPQASSATTNRVLNLPGKGSYAQLPSNIFDGLTEATMEGWTKWTDGQPTPEDYEMALSIGNPKVKMELGSRDRLILQADLIESRWPAIVVPNAVQPGVWFHWALVTGPDGMKLFVNGL